MRFTRSWRSKATVILTSRVSAKEARHYDTKLDNSFSRARSMVLQYALAIPGTTSLPAHWISGWQIAITWIAMQSGSCSLSGTSARSINASFQVLLVPELHQDGAWHIHGLIYGLPASALRPFRYPEPQKLIDGGFLNWPDYQRAFGFPLPPSVIGWPPPTTSQST